MAGPLTPDERWALVQAYGTIEIAIDEALKRSPELQKLWESQNSRTWLSHKGDFAKAFWKRALPVLGIDTAPLLNDTAQSESPQREGALKGEPGRKPETMPAKTFWTIFEMGIAHAESGDETPSLRSIAETTKRREDLEYVPRPRVTPIVDWIAANRRRARGYRERREIPPPFRATVTD